MLSFGTAGCNLACQFCQNHDISKSREVARLSSHTVPETIARAAERLGCASVAYTYNDPVIFMEYAIDVAAACRALGVPITGGPQGFMKVGTRNAAARPVVTFAPLVSHRGDLALSRPLKRTMLPTEPSGIWRMWA